MSLQTFENLRCTVLHRSIEGREDLVRLEECCRAKVYQPHLELVVYDHILVLQQVYAVSKHRDRWTRYGIPYFCRETRLRVDLNSVFYQIFLLRQ